jgi:hypothetical protein
MTTVPASHREPTWVNGGGGSVQTNRRIVAGKRPATSSNEQAPSMMIERHPAPRLPHAGAAWHTQASESTRSASARRSYDSIRTLAGPAPSALHSRPLAMQRSRGDGGTSRKHAGAASATDEQARSRPPSTAVTTRPVTAPPRRPHGDTTGAIPGPSSCVTGLARGGARRGEARLASAPAPD